MAPSDEENNLDFLEELESLDSLQSEDEPKEDDAAATLFEAEDDKPVAEATIISEEEPSSDGSSERNDTGDAVPSEEPGDESDSHEPEGESGEDVPANKPGWIGTFFAVHKSKLVGFLSGAFLLSAVAGVFLFTGGGHVKSTNSPTFQVYLESIQGDTADVLFFDKFLILLGDDDDRAYLHLSMVAIPSNANVYKEVREKRTLCRHAILKVLTNAAASKEAMADKFGGERLQDEIALALNKILVSGSIEKVEFSEILGV